MSASQKRHELHPLAGRQLSTLLVITALPFVTLVPLWVPAFLATFLGWRYAHDEYGYALPSRLPRFGLVAFAAAGILFSLARLTVMNPRHPCLFYWRVSSFSKR